MEEPENENGMTLLALYKETECAICWEADDGEWEQCDNGHCFHAKCLQGHQRAKRSLRIDPLCPTCRCWLVRGARVVNRTQSLLVRTVPWVEKILGTVADLQTQVGKHAATNRQLAAQMAQLEFEQVALRERAERAESSAAELRARAERAEAQRSSDQPTWSKEQAWSKEQVARYEVYAMRHAAVQELYLYVPEYTVAFLPGMTTLLVGFTD